MNNRERERERKRNLRKVSLRRPGRIIILSFSLHSLTGLPFCPQLCREIESERSLHSGVIKPSSRCAFKDFENSRRKLRVPTLTSAARHCFCCRSLTKKNEAQILSRTARPYDVQGVSHSTLDAWSRLADTTAGYFRNRCSWICEQSTWLCSRFNWESFYKFLITELSLVHDKI